MGRLIAHERDMRLRCDRCGRESVGEVEVYRDKFHYLERYYKEWLSLVFEDGEMWHRVRVVPYTPKDGDIRCKTLCPVCFGQVTLLMED